MEAKELVSKIKGLVWPGSSVSAGVMYHDLPFPPFNRFNSHRKGTKIRWDLISKYVSFRDKTVLDLGCSVGGFSILAALNGATKVVGIDYDPESIAVAREIATKVGVNVDFRNCVIDSKLIENIEHFDITIWLAHWMWLAKSLGMEDAKRLLRIASEKSSTMIFESAADEGMAPIKGATQADIEKIFRENTVYKNVKNVGVPNDGWIRRNIFIGET